MGKNQSKFSCKQCCEKNLESKSDNKIVSIQLDHDYDKAQAANWPFCDYQPIIKIGSRCIMLNQKDVANGLGLK